MNDQKELFNHVLEAYAQGAGVLSNEDLYRQVGERAGIDEAEWGRSVPIGRDGEPHSPLKRRVRWYQQTLRSLGLLERDGARGRGHWRLTPKGREKLTAAEPRRVLVGFSTELGLALWSSCDRVFASIDEPITLCLTSPPYPLATPRAYGNPTAAQYVDWLCAQIEPIVKLLVPGGSICLNISNDIFVPGTPARDLYRERLVIALVDRFGLHKLDELIWHNPSKPPGPLRWASITRQQLNVAWEPVYWFTNDPVRCKANNRRVLQEHTDRHMRLIREGGEQRTTCAGDGAYRLRHGSYAAPTEGRIPRNVLTIGHRCADREAAARAARTSGLPVHGATMPVKLAQLLVEFLSEEGDLVADPFGGWFTTARAAENTGRRWISTELMGEYVIGAAHRFREAAGFEMNGSIGALATA